MKWPVKIGIALGVLVTTGVVAWMPVLIHQTCLSRNAALHSQLPLDDRKVDNGGKQSAAAQSGNRNDGYAVRCIGYIRYTNGDGAFRETGFCRVLSGDGTQWLPEAVTNSVYEYEY